jgi:hypothetical protein
VNGNTDTTAHDHTARIAPRMAWFCAFVLPLVLAALLLGVKSAQAASSPPESAPLAFEEEFEAEEEGEETEAEFAAEECEIADEEFEEGEITKTEADAICKEARGMAKGTAPGPGSAAQQCPIHSASAHASTHNNELKLTLGYTTTTPVTAVIQLRGPGNGSFKRHLGQSGVLHFTLQLGKRHGRLVVQMKLPANERAGCPSRRLVLFPG